MFVLFWMVPPIMSRGFFTKMWGYCGKYWRCLLSGRKDGPRTSTAYKNPVREVPAPLQPLEYTQNKSENKSKIVQNFRLNEAISGSRVHGIWGTPARLRSPRGARSGQPFTAASRASAAVCQHGSSPRDRTLTHEQALQRLCNSLIVQAGALKPDREEGMSLGVLRTTS